MNTAKQPTELKVVNGGPLIVKGEVKLILPDGTEQSGTKMFICRCGKSANKPFCDGSHAK